MADDSEFDFLSTIKTLLNIRNDDMDDILLIHIDIARNSILNYCNINELPSALNFTLCQIVVDAYLQNRNKTDTGKVVGNVSSISEDGRSVSFTNGTEFQSTVNEIISGVNELKRYRKLYKV